MRHYNPKNERVKKDYFRFLREADRKAESTVDAVRKAISRYEAYTGLKDFATFNREQAVAFKKHLAKTKAERSGEPLAKATLHATINSLKAFFKWLSCQPGYQVPHQGDGHRVSQSLRQGGEGGQAAGAQTLSDILPPVGQPNPGPPFPGSMPPGGR